MTGKRKRIAYFILALLLAFTGMQSGFVMSGPSYAENEQEQQAPAVESEQPTGGAEDAVKQGEQPVVETPTTPTPTTGNEQPANATKQTTTKPTEKQGISLKTNQDGVIIKLDAETGTFPEGVSLSVASVPQKETAKVDKAVAKERNSSVEVTTAYTFDIKVLDKTGKEVQPAAGKTVKLSFTTGEVGDKKMNTRVFHVKEDDNKLNATELSVITDGDTATVSTDGFSYYTVEFTYADGQYVLDGGDYIKLDDLLKAIDIKGKVKGITVSAPELFNVLMGDKDGVKTAEFFVEGKAETRYVNNPKGTIRYIVSYEPFDTEEWMDVLMEDGTTYHIIVTDAITDSGLNTGNIAGVAQGTIDDYTSTMPLGDIWIDSTMLDTTAACRSTGMENFIPGPLMNKPGFVLYDTLSESGTGHANYTGRYFIEYDTTQQDAALSGSIQTTRTSDGATVYQSYNQFDGLIGTCVWPDAAVRLDANGVEEKLDVFIEYWDPLISFQHGVTGSIETDPTQPVPTIDNRILGLFSGNMITVGQTKVGSGGPSGDVRYGVKMTIKPIVKDKSGNVVTGNFYYPMKDIDVNRQKPNDNIAWKTFYQANSDYANYSAATNAYSESVTFDSNGIYTNSRGESVFIPGAPGDTGGDTGKYKSNIVNLDGEYVVYPGSTGDSGTGTPYTGFMVLAKNGDFSIDFIGSAPNANGGMESYVLSGQDYNFKLRHSTWTGGNIRTTYEGNHSGKLDDGSAQINPQLIATAKGQTITYTFYPDAGYTIDKLYVISGANCTNWPAADHDPVTGEINYESIHNAYAGSEVVEGTGANTYQAWDDDGDGTIDRYTYTFSGINSDNAIHVTWQKTRLTITKRVTGNDVVDDTFTFRIRAWKDETDPGTGNTTTDYVDFAAEDTDFTSAGDNWYTFTLQNMKTKNVDENVIPVGYKWEVEEVSPIGTQGNWECISPAGGKASGEFTQDSQTQQANFLNKRNKVIPPNRLIQVKKVWDGDMPELRPSSLTMHATSRSGGMTTTANGASLKTYMQNLAGGDVSNITAFKQGTKAQCEAATDKVNVASAGVGVPIYFWYSGGTIYFYSDAEVYLNDDATSMFDTFTNLSDISGLANIHVDYTENFYRMFCNCYNISNLSPLANWNTQNATNMYRMFGSGNVSGNASNHKPMTYTSLEPLRNWNVKGVTNMSGMFRGANITSVAPIAGWQTLNLTTMEEMFWRSQVTDARALNGWDVTHVLQNSSGANGFKQVFRQGTSGSTITTNLPSFTQRTGSWDGNGTFIPMTPASSPPGQSATDWTQRPTGSSAAGTTELTETYHEVQPDGSWLYEFEVPEGTETRDWNVYEDVPTGYYVLHNGTRDKGSVDDQVTDVHTGDTVTLTNRPITRTLTIGKRIDEVLESDEEFTFTVKFWSGNVKYSNPYNLSPQPAGLTKTGEGTYTFKLKTRGLSAVEQTIPEIPYGIKYEVTEASKAGWRQVAATNTFGLMNENKTASFLNSKNTNGIVVKKWDDHNNRFDTRPSGRDAISVTATIRNYKWEQNASTVVTVVPGQTEYDDIDAAYNDAAAEDLTELEKNIVDQFGDLLTFDTPKHITYNSTEYVCDKKSNGEYNYFKVTEAFTNRTARSSDNNVIFRADDNLNAWYYEFPMSKTERLINANESSAPIPYYTKGQAVETEEGMVWQVTNTLKTHNLTVTKNVSDPANDRMTTFNYAIKFWAEVDQTTAHPVKFMHSQFLTTQIDGEPVNEYELVFERGVTLGGKNVKGLHEKIGNTIHSHPDSGLDRDKITLTESDTITNALSGFTISDSDKVTGETWSDDTTMYRTGLRLSDLGLSYGGHDYQILVEQPPAVVNDKTSNGRRIDYFIVPTGETSFSVRTPYTGLDSELSQYGSNGTYHFTLRNGGSFTFSNLPAGVHYEVVEYRKDGWTLESKTNTVGTLPDANQTATFTNRIQKGNIKITKKTEQNEPGNFSFRAKIWKVEDFAEVKGIPTTNGGTVNDIVGYILAMGQVVKADQFVEYFAAIEEYAANNGITGTKELDEVQGVTGNGITANFVNRSQNPAVNNTVSVGTYDYIAGDIGVTIDPAFKTQAEAIDGETHLYVAVDNVLIGAVCGEHEEQKKHYLNLRSQGLDFVGDNTYEFQLSNNGTKTLTDIPYGYQYEIWEETTEGWQLVSVDNDGNGNKKADDTMKSTGTIEYTFNNDRVPVSLTVKKEVAGNQGSRDKYFKFKIEIERAGKRTLHLDMTNATTAFETGADGTKAPNGATAYTRNTILTGSGTEGGNTRDDGPATYGVATDYEKQHCQWTDDTYTYDWDEVSGEWIQTEIATGTPKDDPTAPPNTATRTYTHGRHIKTGDDGKATIYVYLQHGESVTIRDLPCDSAYEVTEVNEDYRSATDITGPYENNVLVADLHTNEVRSLVKPWNYGDDSGIVIPCGDGFNSIYDTRLLKDTEITFTNTKSGAIPTEVRYEWLLGPILLMLAMLYGYIRYRRWRRNLAEEE